MALTKVPSNLDATIATTQSASDNSTNVATTAYVTTAVSNLVDGAPAALNTLNEIAAALNDDAALNTTLTNSIATKLPLAGGNLTGNLGIGASSPSFPLHINSSSTDVAKFQTSGSYAYTRFQNSSKTWALSVGSDFGFYDEAASATRMLIDGSGKVGIAEGGVIYASRFSVGKPHTHAPGSAFTNSPSSFYSEVQLGSTTGNDQKLVTFAGTDGSNVSGLALYRYRRATGTNWTTDGFSLRQEVDNTENIYNYINFAAGNVGIGSSSPAGKLHVYSGDAGAVTPSSQADDLVVENSAEGGITIMTPDDQSARIRFTSPSTESGDVGGADIFYRQNINKMSMGTTVSGGKLAFKSGAGVETMILDGGQVGIGTSPGYSLDVVGPGTSNGVTLNLTDAASSANSKHLLLTRGSNTAIVGVAGSQANDPLWISRSGGYDLMVASNGNVGVGNSNPPYKLSVSGTGGTRLMIENTNTNWAALDIRAGGNQANYIFFKDDSAERARIQVTDNEIISFLTGNSPAQRFAINGSVVDVGTSTNGGSLNVYGQGSQNETNDAKIYAVKNSSADWSMSLISGADDYGIRVRGNGAYALGVLDHNANLYRARIHYSGYIYSSDGTIHDIDSDVRLKEEIVAAPSQWQMIKDLPLQKYKWKDRRHGDIDSYGWIAQEVEKKYPEFVEPIPQTKEAVDAGEQDPEYLTVKTGDITRRALAALQEAMTRIETLEAEVAALKG